MYTKKVKRKKLNHWALFFAILLVISGALNIFLFQNKQPLKSVPAQPSSTYRVIGIYDGDTFIIEGKRRIRLRHLQAPELDMCGGQEAKQALTKLVQGKDITLIDEIPDTYGRPMAMIFVGDTNVNKVLVETGVARYHHDATDFEDEMKLASKTAEERKLGIFKNCESKTPKDAACIIKGNIRPGKNSHIYFLPTCAQYKTAIISEDLGEKWFCSEKEAKEAGFIKADTCKR